VGLGKTILQGIIIMKKGLLILVRHGQSEWNKQNIFTGWVDVSLSKEGVKEAHLVGETLKNTHFDVVFTSTLIRAQTTAVVILSENLVSGTAVVIHPKEKWSEIHSEKTKKSILPVIEASELNERMYGDLQGKNKQETAEEFGKEQVHIWRRSFEGAPPSGESLKTTSKRTLPYFHKEIMPKLEEGKTVLVVAHGNSLRAMIKEIKNLSEEEIVNLEIATGVPLCYSLEDEKFTPVELSQLLHKKAY
jgi:2,3-bisphosphoglycerate-dependent phosphoglycerate mutase